MKKSCPSFYHSKIFPIIEKLLGLIFIISLAFNVSLYLENKTLKNIVSFEFKIDDNETSQLVDDMQEAQRTSVKE